MGTPRGPNVRQYADPMTKRTVNVSLFLSPIEDEALVRVAKQRRTMSKAETIRALILEADQKKGQ